MRFKVFICYFKRVITLYRAPSDNCSRFFLNWILVLQVLYAATLRIIICEDININYLTESEKENHLDIYYFCIT